MKKLIIVKLGGGLIAPKDWEPETVDKPTLRRLCQELATIAKRGVDLLVVSGSGNFGHAAVKKYGLTGKLEAAKVQRIAQKIGGIVTQTLLDQNIPATLIAPHDLWKKGNGKIITESLNMGLVPVLYGDVIWDREKTGVIFSGETCIAKLLPALVKDGWHVEKIVQASCEEGVWDGDKKIIPNIDSLSWKRFKKSVSGAAGVDFTGGMLHKVEESLQIAKKYGIRTLIINGAQDERLTKTLLGKKVVGTTIC